MRKYPKFLMEHFQNPKNVGEISDPDGVGIVGNASCGDIMQLFIKVNGNRISEAMFKTFGCGAAIATSSILTERIKGCTIEEAVKISERISEEILSQVPEEKIACFNLATDALKLAVEEFRCKQIKPEREGEFSSLKNRLKKSKDSFHGDPP